MTTMDAVAHRWVARIIGDSVRGPLRGCRNVFEDGAQLYSYGRHFELGRALHDRKGRPVAFLLNGDRYSVSTGRHQSATRDAVAGSGLPSFIVPYSALGAAGIDRSSIQLLEASKEGSETIRHDELAPPAGATWHTEDVHEYVDLTADELAAIVAHKDAVSAAEHDSWRRWAADETVQAADGSYSARMSSYWTDRLAKQPMPETHTVDDISEHSRREYRKTGTRQVLYADARRRRTPITVVPSDDGPTRYQWETYRHWLGESLFSANVTYGRTCWPCKGTGQTGRFVIDGRYREACEACLGRGTIVRTRRATFLSGFDANEARRSYFLCELPKTDARTIVDAYAALRPDAVKLAEGMGRTVYRQGDIFAIELSANVTRQTLREDGATFERMGTLLGTNHVATEVARMPDGRTLARGILHHAPGGRRPDHARRPIGAGWCAIVKNTVPLTH